MPDTAFRQPCLRAEAPFGAGQCVQPAWADADAPGHFAHSPRRAGVGIDQPFQYGEPGRAAYRALKEGIEEQGIQHCVVPGCEKRSLDSSANPIRCRVASETGRKICSASCSAAGTPHSARSQLTIRKAFETVASCECGTPGATNAAQEGVSLPSAPPMEISSSPAMGRTNCAWGAARCCVPPRSSRNRSGWTWPASQWMPKKMRRFPQGIVRAAHTAPYKPKASGLTRPVPIREAASGRVRET